MKTSRYMLWATVSAGFILVTSAFAQRTIHVSPFGSNTPPYANWVGAATTLPAAISEAAAGDTVLVDSGTYHLTSTLTLNKDNLNLRSFNGPDVTFINGGYPSYTNACITVTQKAVIEGFTITNGNAQYSGVTHQNGSDLNQGGGINFTSSGNANGSLVTNCVIASNRARSGGGLFLGKAVTVTDCIISNNLSGSYGGGGISCVAKASILGSLITHNRNSASSWAYGGGLHITDGLVSNCTIQANTGRSQGGGVYMDGAACLRDCRIIHNNTDLIASNFGGGGVYMISGLLDRCEILENTNTHTFSFGGGIFVDRVTNQWVTASEDAIVQNCLIAGNYTVKNGAGIYSKASPGKGTNITIRNCTIVNNTSPASSGAAGSGICHLEATGFPSLVNTIILGNTGNAMYPNWYNVSSASHCFTFPVIPNGSGNLTGDPIFADSANGNWHLTRLSPCVNKGENQSWMDTATDLDRGKRKDVYSGTVDLGCYEFVSLLGATIAYWRFEPGSLTTDASGNGFTLTNVGALASTDVPAGLRCGSEGSAQFINASNSYMKTVSTMNLTICPQVTIEWFMKNTASSGTQYAWEHGISAGGMRAYLNANLGNGGGMVAPLQDLTGGGYAYREEPLPGGMSGNRWHHYAFQIDCTNPSATGLKLFIDGEETGTFLSYKTLTPTAFLNKVFLIGARAPQQPYGYMDGSIDEFRISEGLLSPDKFLNLKFPSNSTVLVIR